MAALGGAIAMSSFDKWRFSRRAALRLAGLAAVGAATGRSLEPSSLFAQETPSSSARPTADEALQLLMEGNARWAASQMQRPNQSADRRAVVAGAQQPFAIVFSCIDSRVPPELVF